MAAPHCLCGSNRGGGTRPFTAMHSGGERFNWDKLKPEEFRLRAGRNVLLESVVAQRGCAVPILRGFQDPPG